jgi:hypothetical protein
MGIQKKMDAENFDHRIKESNIALESKKNELNELMRLLNNEKEERKKTQIQVLHFCDFEYFELKIEIF